MGGGRGERGGGGGRREGGGGLGGWVASKIMITDAQQGIILNIVVGIVGALLGGFLLGLFGMDREGASLIASFLTGRPSPSSEPGAPSSPPEAVPEPPPPRAAGRPADVARRPRVPRAASWRPRPFLGDARLGLPLRPWPVRAASGARLDSL